MYYNYRDYNPTDGRWLIRDPIGEISDYNLYRFVKNRINNIVDKKSRRCYIVFLRREPINTEAIKNLPWLADRAFLMAHTGKCSNGDILVNSGGKVIRVPNREPIVYIIGCHRAAEVNGGKTIPISGAMQTLINKLKEIKGKDCCPCEEKILITGGSKDPGYY